MCASRVTSRDSDTVDEVEKALVNYEVQEVGLYEIGIAVYSEWSNIEEKRACARREEEQR